MIIKRIAGMIAVEIAKGYSVSIQAKIPLTNRAYCKREVCALAHHALAHDWSNISLFILRCA